MGLGEEGSIGVFSLFVMGTEKFKVIVLRVDPFFLIKRTYMGENWGGSCVCVCARA